MKILVVGGTHGDERTGIKLANHLIHSGFKNIDALIANPLAVNLDCRFVKTDLNRSFGVKRPKSYEERRAKGINRKLAQYDIILDFHNITSKTAFGILVTENPTVSQIAVLKFFGFRNAVIIDQRGSLCGQNPLKSIGFEVSTHGRRFSESFFFEKMKKISKTTALPSVATGTVNFYYYSGQRVTMTQLRKAGLTIKDFSDFKPIKKVTASILGIRFPSVPYLIKERAYGKDFAFGVAIPCNKNSLNITE